MEDFSRKVETNLENGPTHTHGSQRNQQNLSKTEIAALQDLKTRDEIIIKKEDKGGAVVVQDVGDYIKVANRQLSDATYYKKVTDNPTNEHAALVENALDGLKHRGLLEEKLADRSKPVGP